MVGDAVVEVLDIDWAKQSDRMPTHKDINGRSGDLPSTSTPNSSQDLYVNGELWQRRFYDNDGNMIKDIDFIYNDKYPHPFPHEHFWEWINGNFHRK